MDEVRVSLCCLLMVVEITASIKIQKTVGIQLCKDECFRTGGCEGFHFDHVHLQCHLQFDERDPNQPCSDNFMMNSKQKKPTMCEATTCLVAERCIITRQGNSVCVKTQASRPRGYSQRRHLLIVPKNSKSQTQCYKLNLDTGLVEKDTFFKLKNVLVVLYMMKAEKLLISTSNPGKIQFFNLYGDELAVLKNEVRAVVLAHDEERQLVFFVESSDRDKIMRISVVTKELECLSGTHMQGMRITSLVVDSFRQILYAVNDTKTVLSFSYNGNNAKVIFNRTGVHSLQFDSKHNALYYADRYSIYTRTLCQNKESLLTKLEDSPVTVMHFYEHKIFIFTLSSTIRIVDVKTKQVRYIASPYKWAWHCVIS